MTAENQITLSLEAPKELVTHFDRAMYHLAKATRIDETMAIKDQAEQMKLLGRQAKDKTLQADAAELAMRAERRLGEILIAAFEAGQLSKGRRKSVPGGNTSTLTLDEVGIDRKLSSKAQALAGSPEAIFEQTVRESRDKILAGKAIVINPIKDVTKKQKQILRRVKEAQLAAKAKSLPKEVYQLIYADPEWKFETWSENGLDRGAENHYPTSDLAAIKARPVGKLAAKDCVLFMWVTAPFHAAGHGAAVMRYWGFEPKAEWIWDKVEPATGYWNRGQHEILLVGVRGNVPAPAMGTQYPSVMRSPKGAHSEKPDWAYELIEAYFPNLKKIELNARRRRTGWDAWGYEAPEDEELSAGAEEARQLDGEEYPERESGTAREASGGQPLPGDGDIGGLSEGVATPEQHGVQPAPAPIETEAPALRDGDPLRSTAAVAAEAEAAAGGEGNAHDLPANTDAPDAPAPMTRDEAEPILRKHYATRSGAELSDMLGGVPIGTIRTWAFHFKLTSKQRIRDMAVARNKQHAGVL